MKRNKIYKFVLPIAAIFIFLGLAACLFVEPVVALNHDESHCADQVEHCCFMCSPGQHQWDNLKSVDFVHPPQITVFLHAVNFQVHSHPQITSIYHPPPVSLRI